MALAPGRDMAQAKAERAAKQDQQKQHVQMFRKVRLRQRLLSDKPSGLAYVPFIGDADIALECFQGYKVYGADLDPKRVETAQQRLDGGIIRVADCDKWPFRDLDFSEESLSPFTVGDFDAYNYPYDSFRAWFENAPLGDRLAVFFTDAQLTIYGHARRGHGTSAGPSVTTFGTLTEARAYLNFYPNRTLLPWLEEYAATKGYRVTKHNFYRTVHNVLLGSSS